MKVPLVPLFLLGFTLASPLIPAQAAEGLLKKATFCRGFEENSAPKNVAEFFMQDETVNLSLELKGRPKSGKVAAKFMFQDHPVGETEVDVATVNEGVIFSFGQNTFVRFELTHKAALPVGDCYSVITTFDGKPLGTFPFRIAPPKGSLPSKLLSITLAKGRDKEHKPEGETREFDSTDKVCLVGVADLGLSSWLEVIWKVAGKVDDAGGRVLDVEENKASVPFMFSYLPENGWPTGKHEVSLQLNGQEVAKEKFTVKAAAPADNAKLVIDSFQLFRDDGKGDAGKQVKAFSVKDTALHARWNLKEKTHFEGGQCHWMLVEVEGEEEQLLATADIESGVTDQIDTSLAIKKGLPPGKYRIDLVQDDKIIDTKPFEIK